MKLPDLVGVDVPNSTITHVDEVAVGRFDLDHGGGSLPPLTYLAGGIVVQDDHLIVLGEMLVPRPQVVVMCVRGLTHIRVRLGNADSLLQTIT